MNRSETRIEDGMVAVETETGWLEIGSLESLYEAFGGETVEIQYGDQQVAFANWLDTNEDGVMTLDVRETLADMSFPEPFVERLAERDGPEESSGRLAPRTAFFADVMADVWEQKGDMGEGDANPFMA